MQVFLVTGLPFAAQCQVRREVSCGALVQLSAAAAHTYMYTHTSWRRGSGVTCGGTHFSSFQVLRETLSKIYAFVFVLHCPSRKPRSEPHASFFLFKRPLITCYVQNGSSLNRIYPKTVLIKQS